MEFDIVIVGGGPAGLSFAAALAGSGLRLAVVERLGATELADPPFDGREIALTHRSVELLQGLGEIVAGRERVRRPQPDRHAEKLRHAVGRDGSHDHAEAKQATLRKIGRDDGFPVNESPIRGIAVADDHCVTAQLNLAMDC